MSISHAERWLKSVILGQPLHRNNLGEENASNGTLRGVSPVSLKLAPQLQRELTQELQNAPKPAPSLSVPQMGPGGNRSGGAGKKTMPNMQNRTPKPPQGGQEEN